MSEADAKTYSHGGDLGDTIAGLAALMNMGGGHLVLHPYRVRCPWTAPKVEKVRSFFEVQEYVRSVRFAETPEGTRLDPWRRKQAPPHLRRQQRNILDWHTDALGLPRWPHDKPWLRVDEHRRVAPVVMNRTARYHGVGFPWAEIVQKHGHEAVVIGTPAEHAQFVAEFGPVAFYETPDLLDAARVIAAADLFVGNQSTCRWIAEGLKRPVWVEEWADDANTHFDREGARYGGRDPQPPLVKKPIIRKATCRTEPSSAGSSPPTAST